MPEKISTYLPMILSKRVYGSILMQLPGRLTVNTLMVGVMNEYDETVVLEVTTYGEIVWELRLKNALVRQNPGWFYKAQRISS